MYSSHDQAVFDLCLTHSLLDDAALQAARTSAALQQLAQQIWERDER